MKLENGEGCEKEVLKWEKENEVEKEGSEVEKKRE